MLSCMERIKQVHDPKIMKSRILMVGCLSLMIGCATIPHSSSDRRPSNVSDISPRLFMQPAFIFDLECQRKTGFKVDPTVRSEFLQKLGSFQSEWDRQAQSLISASENAAGRSFARKEYSVALTLCAWTPMGDPAFIVSVRPYLGLKRSEGKTKLPLSMAAFVSMTHHELLHSLVENIVNSEFSATSALLEKYKAEPFNVLVHLHLMAIQKAANEQLGDQDLLQATEDLYAYIGGDYARAWEIVRTEGAQKFLNELRAYNSREKRLNRTALPLD